MRINSLCKRLALHEVFDFYEVQPGSGLLKSEIIQCWDRTGLRRGDIDEAVGLALAAGDVVEMDSHEGRLAVLTDEGYARAQHDPETLHEIDQLGHALMGLEWAKRRKRMGRNSGRRAGEHA